MVYIIYRRCGKHNIAKQLDSVWHSRELAVQRYNLLDKEHAYQVFLEPVKVSDA
jgi:hypothetical protein